MTKDEGKSVELQSYGNTAVGMVQQTGQARAVAEVQAQIVVAKMYPRDESVSIAKVKKACARASLAEKAVYSYKRGTSLVSGASIRLAEAVATAWGNMNYGFTEEREKGYSVARCFAYDIENNVRAERTFTVPHKRSTKEGVYEITDPRDIYEMVANQASRRVRACILEVIPGDIVEMAVDECKRTLAQNVKLDANTATKVEKSFAQDFGITKAQIEAKLGMKLTDMDGDTYVTVRGWYAALSDGQMNIDEFLDGVEVEEVKPKKQLKAKSIPNNNVVKDVPPVNVEVVKDEVAVEDTKAPEDFNPEPLTAEDFNDADFDDDVTEDLFN